MKPDHKRQKERVELGGQRDAEPQAAGGLEQVPEHPVLGVGEPRLRPEQSESLDVGVTQHLGESAEFSLVLFDNDYEDLIDLTEELFVGLLHDLGKVGISDSILNKPGKLTDEEFAIMKSHPSIGAQIIGGIAGHPRASHSHAAACD